LGRTKEALGIVNRSFDKFFGLVRILVKSEGKHVKMPTQAH
jgi:hypothetical protein